MKLPVFNYSITNATDDSAEIHIDGDIVDATTQEIYKNWFGDETSVSFRSFRQQVEKLNVKNLTVYINSGGGQVIEAMAMHDFINELKGKGVKIRMVGRGLIASAATFILMAGDEPEMSENSWFMIHNVSGGVRGNVNEIENYAVLLRKFNDRARDFYSMRTGIRKEEITKMMNSESWLTAKEAEDQGFVKKVTDEASFTNAIKKEDWIFGNTTVLNSYNSSVKPVNTNSNNNLEDMKKIFTDGIAAIMNAIKGTKPVEQKEGEPFNQTALLEAIANSMKEPFEAMGTAMEAQVDKLVEDRVVAVFADPANPLNVKHIAPLQKANTDLKAEFDELQTEVTQKLGAPTNTPADPNTPKAIGTFS